MADRSFHLEIVTPRGLIYDGQVNSVTVPGVKAPFTVLRNHAPILSELEIGDLRVMDAAGDVHHFATSGGFAEMKHNKLSIIAETIEAAESIDVERARRARIRADERVREARVNRKGG